jgi:quercetin dioxygenase-like cupin family protein
MKKGTLPVWKSFTRRSISRRCNREKGGPAMKKVSLYESSGFEDAAIKRFMVHDSPYFKIINFNFRPGQELPIHSHDIEGQVSIVIIEGVGEFLGKDGATLPARTGDVLICDIAEPHGLRAKSELRALVTIAPPI